MSNPGLLQPYRVAGSHIGLQPRMGHLSVLCILCNPTTLFFLEGKKKKEKEKTEGNESRRGYRVVSWDCAYGVPVVYSKLVDEYRL